MIKYKAIRNLSLLLVSLMSFSACNHKLSGLEALDFIKNPENGLSKALNINGKQYRLNYWPKSLSGNVPDNLLFFELSSIDGKALFTFSEQDFQIEVEQIFIPATIVLPENFGSPKNHLLIGFQETIKPKEITLRVGRSANSQEIVFNQADINKINQSIAKS